MPSRQWVDHVIWWQTFPLGFVGAEATQVGAPIRHRLPALVDWLDYVVELGASGLALGPIFESGSHGYDTVDYYRVDARLGDLADFDQLVTEARRRGLRVLLDGVFNHVGRDFPRFARIAAEGRTAPDQDWFRLHWPADARPGAEPEYDMFEGHAALVELNHETPAVIDYIVDVMRYWLDRGVDGWRLDAAYAMPSEAWSEVIGRVRESHPEAYLVGEVIHGDYPGVVRTTGMDAVTQYELWKAIRSSLNDRNLFELAWSLQRHAEFLDTFVPLTFVGNHDVTRIASALLDPQHLPHAHAVLFLIGGTPTIYYGDERGLAGIKEDRVGGDDAVRPAFPSSPADLDPAGAELHRLHRELIAVRRRHPWLHRARTTTPVLDNTGAVLESALDGRRLRLAINLAGEARDLSVPDAISVIAGAATLTDAGSPTARVTVPPYGWAVLADPSSGAVG